MSRRSDSVRFDPYFKVQAWDPVSMAWRDIQRSHPSLGDAIAATPAGGRWRIMEVTPNGRRPVYEGETFG